MQHYFILNPAAGKGTQIEAVRQNIVTYCEKNAIQYTVYMTNGVGNATEYVRNVLENGDGNETYRFYACGGDGTLSEVLNGTNLAENAEIAIIPIGTGNDFWKNFDNRDNFYDIEKQVNGTPHKIDVITYNGKYCANMINIGFDCDVVKKTAKIKRHFWIPERLAYIFGVVSTLFRKFGKKMRIEFPDGRVVERSLLLTAIANGQFCGGGYDAAPRAKINDNMFDLCLINKVSRLTFIRLVSKYRAGTHIEATEGKNILEYCQLNSLKYTFDEETDICIDGEIEKCRELSVGILHNAVKFSVPSGSKISDRSYAVNCTADT